MRRTVSIAMSIALSLGLSGCFSSAKDLLTAKDADYPIADGAQYRLFGLAPDTKFEDGKTTVEFKRNGASYVWSQKSEFGTVMKEYTGMADQVAPNTFLIQYHEKDAQTLDAHYVGLTVEGVNLFRHDFQCEDFKNVLVNLKAGTMESYGAKVDGQDCVFSNLAGLRRAAVLMVKVSPKYSLQPVKQ